MSTKIEQLAEAISSAKHLSAFTGAGASTLSGLRDFRGENGLYKEMDADKIFDLLYFHYDPSFYYNHTRELIYTSDRRDASIVHTVLAKLERLGLLKALITQNIDLLHQKAGSEYVIEIHGSPLVHRCVSCGNEKGFSQIVPIVERGEVPRCESCGGVYKPDITFFGEALPPDAIREAVDESMRSDLMLVLGSTLQVYPAAGIPERVLEHGGQIALVNRGSTHLDRRASFVFSDLEEVFSELDRLF
jgi:NAD-dependent deacetylase